MTVCSCPPLQTAADADDVWGDIRDDVQEGEGGGGGKDAAAAAAVDRCCTLHVTRHTTHVTQDTSYVTRHTSHVTRCSPMCFSAVAAVLVKSGRGKSGKKNKVPPPPPLQFFQWQAFAAHRCITTITVITTITTTNQAASRLTRSPLDLQVSGIKIAAKDKSKGKKKR